MIAKEEEPAKFGNPVSNPKVVKAELGTDAPQWMVDLDRDGVSGAVRPLICTLGSVDVWAGPPVPSVHAI
jgi:hypothetical protein